LRLPTTIEAVELAGLFLAHFIGGLLPLWGSWLLLTLSKESASITDFIRHGEFLLYSASLLPTAAFLMLRDFKTPFPQRLIVGLVIIFLLVVSSLMFAGVFTITRHDVETTRPSVNVPFLAWVSIPLYLISLIAMLIATFFDMIVLSFDPLEKQERDEKNLAEQFRKLKG